MLRVISWNNGQSARAISEAVSNGRLIRNNSTHRLPRPTSMLINFGCSQIQRDVGVTPVLNRPESVQLASSKLATFQTCAAVGETVRASLPWFTIDRNEAVLKSIMDGVSIVCRTVDNGHGGAGIVVKTPEELQDDGNLPAAHLYVQAIKKRREYRVHVGRARGGMLNVLDIQRKVRRSGVQDGGVNGDSRPFIWNHENDFIFQRGGVDRTTVPIEVMDNAFRAVRALGLDFAAVDVVVEQQTGNVYVLEVNTSPGMEGTTLERYISFFQHKVSGSPFPFWYGDNDVDLDDEG